MSEAKLFRLQDEWSGFLSQEHTVQAGAWTVEPLAKTEASPPSGRRELSERVGELL